MASNTYVVPGCVLLHFVGGIATSNGSDVRGDRSAADTFRATRGIEVSLVAIWDIQPSSLASSVVRRGRSDELSGTDHKLTLVYLN